jgi:2-dehydropantoate 2-reductase
MAAPFPLEVYLKTHFTKVGDQTLAHLRRYLDLGAERGLPTAHLRQLQDALVARRPHQAAAPGLAP